MSNESLRRHERLEIKVIADRLAEVESRLERLESFLRLDVWVQRTGLTGGDVELLKLVAQGYKTARIMSILKVSKRTVLTGRARLHRKLGTDNTAKLTLVAYQLGIVSAKD